MQEVRLHGRGGQGLVKAAHIIVKALVETGNYATFIPFFGVERKGSPVYGFLRLSNEPIRLKTQVYHPDCLVVFDATLPEEVDVFEGIKDDTVLVLNSARLLSESVLPAQVATVGLVNATDIALKHLGRNIPNTAMLGAFCRVTGWVDVEKVQDIVAAEFGPENAAACAAGYRATTLVQVR
ncbi:MAG TPA: pyruvate ferredoxin oxidoreductase [Firmicutes bacterium]|nr:pyruvate ferredoxin oxidoreductase [Bacillota bacterium]